MILKRSNVIRNSNSDFIEELENPLQLNQCTHSVTAKYTLGIVLKNLIFSHSWSLIKHYKYFHKSYTNTLVFTRSCRRLEEGDFKTFPCYVKAPNITVFNTWGKKVIQQICASFSPPPPQTINCPKLVKYTHKSQKKAQQRYGYSTRAVNCRTLTGIQVLLTLLPQIRSLITILFTYASQQNP